MSTNEHRWGGEAPNCELLGGRAESLRGPRADTLEVRGGSRRQPPMSSGSTCVRRGGPPGWRPAGRSRAGGAGRGSGRGAASVRTVRASLCRRSDDPARPLRSEGTFVFRRPGSIRLGVPHAERDVPVRDGGDVRRFTKRDGACRRGRCRDGVDARGARRGHGVDVRPFDESAAFTATLSWAGRRRRSSWCRATRIARFVTRIVVTMAETPGAVASIEIFEGADVDAHRIPQHAAERAEPGGDYFHLAMTPSLPAAVGGDAGRLRRAAGRHPCRTGDSRDLVGALSCGLPRFSTSARCTRSRPRPPGGARGRLPGSRGDERPGGPSRKPVARAEW